MKTTKELYGLSADELHCELFNDIVIPVANLHHEIYCDKRINLLKANLAKLTERDTTDPLINDILKAIDFWQALRDE